jgi:hypothetical protein
MIPAQGRRNRIQGEKGTSPKERQRESMRRNVKKLQFSATSAKCLWRDDKQRKLRLYSRVVESRSKTEGISHLARDLTPVPLSLRLVG